jgi:ABC-2 type transport system ATP-binding protein
MSSTENAIAVRGLVKKFGDFTAVDGIDFEVHQGEIFGLLGPNGSGKTTTIRMMLGLLRPTEGWIEILGVPIIQNPGNIRPRIGYMSQRFSLYNDLTVEQNLTFYGKAYGLKNEALNERMHTAVQMAGLEGHERTKTQDLAGGWRQRLALGAAILHEPELIFLDEPTAGVDPLSRRAFWDLLYELVKRHVTIFVTTHYMDEAEHCHRLALIQRGKLIASGSPEQIKEEKMRAQVLEIAPDDPERTIKILRDAQETGYLSLEEVSLYGALVHVVAVDIVSSKVQISELLHQNGIGILHMTEIEPSLEDVYIASMSAK